MYYRNAQSALVVYDVTKASSLVKARHWVAELQRQASPGIVIALVGNKVDLCEEDEQEGSGGGEEEGEEGNDGEEQAGAKKVSTAEAKAYAEEEGLLFFETSAKTGQNVSEVFTAIANAIPEGSLKGPRGGAAAAGGGGGGGGTTQGTGQSGNESSRINLNQRAGGEGGSKEGCAC